MPLTHLHLMCEWRYVRARVPMIYCL